jgi:hypothetical protein
MGVKQNANATSPKLVEAMLDSMQTQPENMQNCAQQGLDELFAEGLIPFELSAHGIDSLGYDEYIVRFHDSRLHSVDVSRREGHSFKELVRTAVLERVSRLNGLFKKVA